MIGLVRAWWPGPAQSFDRQDAAELAGLLAALSRAGLPPTRIWTVLSGEAPSVAQPAARVAAMLAVGGTVADGLRVAARDIGGEGAIVLGWLMITARVADRTGAASSGVYDGLVKGIDEELDQAGERAVALAGPKATALVLGSLPLAGFGLAALMGVNTLGVLIATTAGHVCLLAGAGLWIAGQRWIRRLLRASEPAPDQMPVTLCLDLLAAVLGAGASPQVALLALAEALETVGADTDTDTGSGLRRAAHGLLDAADRQPAEPAAAGSVRGGAAAGRTDIHGDALLRGIRGAMSLAMRSGLPPAELLRVTAARERSRQAATARAAIRRLEVLLVIPAGICLLPAFVLLGVVPVVIALFGG